MSIEKPPTRPRRASIFKIRVKTVILGNGGFVPYRKQGILTKMAKIMSSHSTHKKKTRFLVLRTPATTEMAKMAGVTQAKPWFTENGVFTTATQKKPDVRNFSARNSGAGKGCANFMGAWHFLFFLLETPMPIKFLLLGGVVVFLEGGVEVPILFLWAWGFFRPRKKHARALRHSRVRLKNACFCTSK